MAAAIILSAWGARAQEKDLRQAQALQKPAQPLDFNSAIQHIVFIIKENRSFDSFFGTFPNADGATSGTISAGLVIPLGHTPDRPSRDLNHDFWYAELAIDNGKMDDFDYGGAYYSVNGDFLCMRQLTQIDLPNLLLRRRLYSGGPHVVVYEGGQLSESPVYDRSTEHASQCLLRREATTSP